MSDIQKRSQSELQEENELLHSENERLNHEIVQLHECNDSLTAKIEILTRKITELEKKLGQNSSNSQTFTMLMRYSAQLHALSIRFGIKTLEPRDSEAARS